jgi:hypothetical protein
VGSHSKDTRLLVAGVVALLALFVYLGVAFANTHASGTAAPIDKVAPWTPYFSTLVPIRRRKSGHFDVRVLPTGRRAAAGTYGAVVQTFVPDPTPGRTYVVALWLRGSRPGRIGVELNEFRPGVSHYPVQTTVPATRQWQHFTFSVRVKGRWLGLAIYVYRVNQRRRTWFAIRGLT